MRSKILVATVIAYALTGCGSNLYNAKWGDDKQPISYFSPTNQKPGTLLAVTANAATVYINHEGKVCIDPADVFRTRNREDSFTGKLGSAGDAAKQVKIEGLDLSTLNKITEGAQLLNSASPATTLFQSGSLGLCQLVINNAPPEAYTSFNELVKQAAEVEKARGSKQAAQ
ncbi:MAG: hypothetical protein M0Q29_03225 [Thiopseudomonas sp.]|nr:hypothetical protein [Thiopseudomonas sp.]MCK9464879.1 hypothetical protein [Thiopseudomonas sp.]